MYNKKEENQNLKLLKEDIKNNKILPLYYFYGEETYLLRKYVASIKKALKGEDVSLIEYDSESYDDDKFYDNLNEVSFFGTKKLIILDNLKFTNRNIPKMILTSLMDKIDENFVIFIDYETDNKYEQKYKFRNIDDIEDIKNVDNPNKKERIDYLLNIINKLGRIVNFSRLDKDEVVRNINSYIKRNNKTIDNYVINYFLELTGLELNTVFNELDKLIAYVGDKEKIEKKDVDSIVSKVLTEKIYAFIDTINQNNKSQAFSLYSDLVMKNVSYRVMFYMIKENFTNLLIIKDKILRGETAKDISNELKLPLWRVEKYIDVARKVEENALIDRLNKINSIDFDFMSGNIKDNFLVELFI